MKPHVVISLASGPEHFFRPAINGNGVGPWMDLESARFLVQWLVLSRSNVEDVMLKLKIEITFEEAIGLPKPAIHGPYAALEAPSTQAVEAQKEPAWSP
jgi:hypothetical protein